MDQGRSRHPQPEEGGSGMVLGDGPAGEEESQTEGREGISRRTLLNGTGAARATAPITANRFSLSVDGLEIATFNELTGITSEIEAAEYAQTTETGVALSKLEGKAKPPTITLRRGVTGSMELWNWHEAARSGVPSARRSCTLTMFNSAGQPVVRYFLERAFPSKLDLAGLKAGSGEVLTETVTLTMERLQRIPPG